MITDDNMSIMSFKIAGMGLAMVKTQTRISKSHFKSRGDSKLQLSVNARAMHKFSIKRT